MEKETILRVLKSYTHRNYEQSIFLLSLLNSKQFKIFLAIFHYDLNNPSKAIHLLKKLNTHTSKYYEGLCYKKLRDYNSAFLCFSQILDNKTIQDKRQENGFDNFLITDFEYVHEQIAECLTFNQERGKAIDHYTCAFQINPLIKPFENLLYENITIKVGNYNKIESEYFTDLLDFIKINKDIYILKYKKMNNELGYKFLNECAKIYAEKSKITEAVLLFEYLRKKDTYNIDNLDVFSSILWYAENNVKLANLSRHLTKHHPESHVTWIVLGNYFSHKSDNKRAIVCFKRSKEIYLNFYALSLIGHESIIRGEYKKAMDYFNTSLALFKNNYIALFGIGIVYEHSRKNDYAELFFNRGFVINPFNATIKTTFLQFYTKNNEFQKALKFIAGVFDVLSSEIEEIFDVMKLKKYTEEEEKFVLSVTSVFIHFNKIEMADEIIGMIKNRNKDYYEKKETIDEIKCKKSIANDN
ncbi:anaphase-promoting complex subunit cdc27 [Gurleya vavrai]